MALERSSRPKLFIIFLSYHQITFEVHLKFPQVVDMTRIKKSFQKPCHAYFGCPTALTLYSVFLLKSNTNTKSRVLWVCLDFLPTFSFFSDKNHLEKGLKVSKFRKQIMVPKLLPKNKPSSFSWKITTSRFIQKESLPSFFKKAR